MRAVKKGVPTRQAAFSRDEIVECALNLLTRDGEEALTVRGVARELGCLPGTINYHFDNLADLEDTVAARLIERLPVLDAARPEPLRDQLVEIGLALIDVISAYPRIRHIIGPVSTDVGARQLRQNWSALQSVGLSEDAAILFMEMVQSFARGRGTELHRLRSGGEPALLLSEELMKKVGRPLPSRLTASDCTAKGMEPFHRTYLGTAIDALLAGFSIANRSDAVRGKRKLKKRTP
jgi:AcrR family transcriptional regulator